MAYVLIGGNAAVERRVETAEEALRAFVELRRAHDRPTIHDGEDQHVSLLGLLARAHWDLRDEASRQRLVATLADYLEIAMNPWTAPFDERLDGYWGFAGATWAFDFRAPVPEAVLDELRRRHADPAGCDELRQGAHERLPRYLLMPTLQRGRWGVWDMREGEYTDLASIFRRLDGSVGVARAQAEALNASRPWTDRDHVLALAAALGIDLDRRGERARRSRAASPPPPSASEARRRPGRRL